MKTEKKIARFQTLINLLEAGASIPDAARSLAVSVRTVYRWQTHPAFLQLRTHPGTARECADLYALERTY